LEAVLAGHGGWSVVFLRPLPSQPDVLGLLQALTLWLAEGAHLEDRTPVIYDDGELGVQLSVLDAAEGVRCWTGQTLCAADVVGAVLEGAVVRAAESARVVVVAHDRRMAVAWQPILRALYGAPRLARCSQAGAAPTTGGAVFAEDGDGALSRVQDVAAVCVLGLGDIGGPVDLRTLENPWSAYAAPALPGERYRREPSDPAEKRMRWMGGDALWSPRP